MLWIRDYCLLIFSSFSTKEYNYDAALCIFPYKEFSALALYFTIHVNMQITEFYADLPISLHAHNIVYMVFFRKQQYCFSFVKRLKNESCMLAAIISGSDRKENGEGLRQLNVNRRLICQDDRTASRSWCFTIALSNNSYRVRSIMKT